jgi:hypothetical protein
MQVEKNLSLNTICVIFLFFSNYLYLEESFLLIIIIILGLSKCEKKEIEQLLMLESYTLKEVRIGIPGIITMT